MKLTEALKLANTRLRRAKNPGVIVSYKDLGNEYAFFASYTGALDGPVGDKVITVNKETRKTAWKSVFKFGREFIVNETRDL